MPAQVIPRQLNKLMGWRYRGVLEYLRMNMTAQLLDPYLIVSGFRGSYDEFSTARNEERPLLGASNLRAPGPGRCDIDASVA